MKYCDCECKMNSVLSHPSRGAWIEIALRSLIAYGKHSRTPRGVRGLKYCRCKINPSAAGSHPSRGAWIEIC